MTDSYLGERDLPSRRVLLFAFSVVKIGFPLTADGGEPTSTIAHLDVQDSNCPSSTNKPIKLDFGTDDAHAVSQL